VSGADRRPFEAAARSLKVAPIAAPFNGDTEIETVITSIGREPGVGLVVTPDAFMVGRFREKQLRRPPALPRQCAERQALRALVGNGPARVWAKRYSSATEGDAQP
jgi:hypothetical protein